MKRFLLKFATIIALSLSIVFGSALLPNTTNPLTESTYATDKKEQDDANDNSETKDNSEGNEGNSTEDASDDDSDNSDEEEKPNVCQGQAGSTSWALCSMLNVASKLVDNVYEFIDELLTVQPISTDHDSPIYKVWAKACEITNIIFVAFILVVIYSQITGFGVNNYGIKRVLPRIIVAVIMVNLSFFISSILVDISNITGAGLVDFFTDIQNNIEITEDAFRHISWGQLFDAFAGGATVGFITIQAMGGIGAAFWLLVIVLFGAVISVVTGLITIGLRQGVVLVLIMTAPFAFVAYLLPNTEKWFQKWKTILAQMLFFYPMFSFLYGSSKLAGWAIINTADRNAIFVLIGFAVQVMPLFFSISLLKMSNTVLGSVNNALNRLSSPLRNTATRWGLSHAELSRQKHLENNRIATGARLQNYLAYRQQLRELDTNDLKSTTTNRNLERAFKHRSSNKGLDENGYDTWKTRPNKSTQIAKTASLQNTITAAAQQNFTNTLSEYGDIFKGSKAKELGQAHGEAFLDIMAQQFRAENIAQGDQRFLLERYLGAAKAQTRDPYEFNRLIGGATGKLGHSGETTIMGQVIKRSSEIEERRRAEARIVMTKFGVRKSDYRGMILDKERVNDNGIEEDENGKEIEDSQYRYRDPKTGEDTSSKHREWGNYIAVHKDTNKEITKEEYNALDSEKRKEYKKIKFMNIYDDEGDVVQRVYEDDAGYMKEGLRKDIAIGDPINRRYATEIGLKLPDSEIARLKLKYPDVDWSKVNDVNKTGKLRRYHSTISGALLETKYAEHAAEFTAMLTAQLDNGYILDTTQRNIGGLQSLLKAAKSGKILQNDAPIIKDWTKILQSVNSTKRGEEFKDYFTDLGIILSRNVNGMEPKGLRRTLDEQGHLIWKEIDRNAPDITAEDLRNWIKHKLIPETAKKVFGAANRRPSQAVLDSLKPDSVEAFVDMLKVIGDMGITNLNPDTPFDDRIYGGEDILNSQSPDAMQNTIRFYQRAAKELKSKQSYNNTGSNNYNGGSNGTSSNSGNGTNSGNSTSGHRNNNNNGGTANFNRDLLNSSYDSYFTDSATATRDIEEIFSDNQFDFSAAAREVRFYFVNHDPLSRQENVAELDRIIEDIQSDLQYNQIDNTQDMVNDLYQAVADLVEHIYGNL